MIVLSFSTNCSLYSNTTARSGTVALIARGTSRVLIRGGGGGGGHENSPRKWPNSHSQKLFLRIFEKIEYYQVSLNTLHTIH